MAEQEVRNQRRREVWEGLRGRRGESRRDEVEHPTTQLLAGPARYSRHFLRLRELVEADEPEERDREAITEEHLAELVDALRARRSDAPAPSEPGVDDGTSQEIPGAERRRMLAVVQTDQFRDNMREWLSSIEPDHELSSTPVDELERLRSGASYRRKLLQAMLEATDRELDALSIHIRALDGIARQRIARRTDEGNEA